MRKPRGELRFHLFKDEIKTRVDRSDPNWLQNLDYSPKYGQHKVSIKKKLTIDFDLTPNRCENEVHSKYPIRQSLKPHIPNNKITI